MHFLNVLDWSVRTVERCAKTWRPWRSRYTRERKEKSASVQRAGRPGYLAPHEARGTVAVPYHTIPVSRVW